MEMHLLETVREDLEKMQAAAARGDGDEVTAALGRLDETLRERRDRLPPRLAHFLEKRSYTKALDFLEAQGAPEDSPDPQ